MKLKYDLHLHSCLSPCGDKDMTPANIAGMAKLAGLSVAALSDHNTTRNCRAFLKCAREYNITGIPAMELNTKEEVHVLCLLPSLEAAEDFDVFVYSKLPDIRNRADFFGEQLLMNEQDLIVGEEPRLLTTATQISIYEVYGLLESYGGLAIPAHIDRSSNSVLSNLGFFSKEMGFSVVEVTRRADLFALAADHLFLRGKPYIVDSDAHYLSDIPDAEFTLETDESTPGKIIQAIKRGAGLHVL